ncbi:hypothetical protein DH2020_030233 [Rehmannia glutinosa]|uniref:ABC transporter domain-containing protein n=2 Tax=Magnoliopsida TaxID=3398 RepID=A0ABR0VN13_REHGL
MAALAGDDLAAARSLSRRSASRRISFTSVSTKLGFPASVREVFTAPGQDAFQRSGREYDDQEELMWAAIERLPTYDDRTRKGILKQVMEDGKIVRDEVDFAHLGNQEKKRLMENILKVVDEDNERFLQRLRDRTDRVGIDIPKVEVRCEHLSVEGDAHVGSRALPTLLNSTLNMIEGVFEKLKIIPSKRKSVKILHDVSGIIKPSRMTLLLGPPGAGKTILLKALAGKLDEDLRVTGKITYCGHEFSEFIPQRTCSYISQHDLHHGEMTVRETLNFSGRCLGVGTRYDLLVELSRREKEAGIKPDPEIDAFMKATAVAGQESSLVTDYVLKIYVLITGEMLVGPAKVFYMDEISTGLDSSTTYQIIKYMRQMVHIMDVTMIISLLQPAPETFELFDDIILLSEGRIVYQGPRENILEFFESVGFKCPDRKGVADFLQEVTSVKDQEQYWFKKNEPYQYVSVAEFVDQFSNFHIGQKLFDDLAVPYDKTKAHPAALVTDKYGISNMELFKACLSREWLLMKRNSFLYIFKTFQITIMSIITFTVFFRTEMSSGQLADGGKFYGALFFSLINVMFNGTAELALTVLRLPVFFKQRDALFYPAWAFSLPIWVLRIPLSLMESLIWIVLTYYTIGFAPEASRFFRQLLAFFALHQMALSLFRFIAALGRTQVVANTLGTFTLLMVFVLGGFIIARDDIEPWMIWGYYVSPMMYGQNAIAINEFLDKRWSTPNTDARFAEPTVGRVLLRMRGMFMEEYMYWVCVAALFAFSILFNICFIVALTYLNPFGDSKSVIVDDGDKKKKKNLASDGSAATDGSAAFAAPIIEAFDHVNYYVDMPAEMKKTGIDETRLQLLRDVSGAFRPGVLTALVGVSGAESIDFRSRQRYCEQTDIHSPHVTVYESIVYSAWLRLSPDVNEETRKMFVEEVMELIELNPLRDALVGLPGVDGLSTEQRKRLTIAVELVANPSIIFMDEPTSGLDARAAAIVMRTVRNTVDTGRTVVCTIHQPSIDIFEAFDELLLMKRGGQVIYAGPLGHHSRLLVEYFQSVPGVPEIKEGYNPATWMLDVTTPAIEAQLNVDFAEIYTNSDLYRRNEELIKQLSTPAPGSQDLYFPTKYAQSFITQCKACFWKQHLSYWRNPQYNAVRSRQQDLMNLLGAMYSAVMFLGGTNTSAVQSVVAVERTVFYREKAAGMYSALPYAFAQVAIETIYIAIQTFIYSLLLYSMIGFEWRADRFFWFYFFVFMCFVYFTSYGMMLVALTPNYQIAAIVMSFFLSFWNLFSGFLISRTDIPIWWRWYYWLSPVAWTIYGLVTSQVGDRTDPVQVPGLGDVPLNEYLDSFLGFKYDFLGAVAGAHVGWAILFCLVFAYGIKFLNFQRRYSIDDGSLLGMEYGWFGMGRNRIWLVWDGFGQTQHLSKKSLGCGHTAVNIGNSKIVFFGGLVDKKFLNDVTVYDIGVHGIDANPVAIPVCVEISLVIVALASYNNMWFQPECTGGGSDGKVGPSPRAFHIAVAIDCHMFIFGGRFGGNRLGDFWVLDTDIWQWSELTSFGDLPSSRDFAAASVVGNSKIVMYGGWDGKKWLSDVYVLDTISLEWTELSVSGTIPPPRCGHSVTMIEKRLLMYGGRGGGGPIMGDLWALKGLVKEGPLLPLAGLSATVWLLVHYSLLLFGGHGTGGWLSRYDIYYNDCVVLDRVSVQWTRLPTSNESPAARAYHSMNCVGSRYLLFGGFDGKSTYGDLWWLVPEDDPIAKRLTASSSEVVPERNTAMEAKEGLGEGSALSELQKRLEISPLLSNPDHIVNELEDKELTQLASRVGDKEAVQALRDHWMKSAPQAITLKELSPLLHDYQRLITRHHIGKLGSNLELVEFGFPGKNAFRFYHVKSASQLRLNDIPNLLASTKTFSHLRLLVDRLTTFEASPPALYAALYTLEWDLRKRLKKLSK